MPGPFHMVVRPQTLESSLTPAHLRIPEGLLLLLPPLKVMLRFS